VRELRRRKKKKRMMGLEPTTFCMATGSDESLVPPRARPKRVIPSLTAIGLRDAGTRQRVCGTLSLAVCLQFLACFSWFRSRLGPAGLVQDRLRVRTTGAAKPRQVGQSRGLTLWPITLARNTALRNEPPLRPPSLLL
jgi:hypothetical protein